MSFAVVLFPQPDSPTRANVSPGAIEKLMSSTACTQPTVLIRISPRVTGKCFLRFSRRIRALAAMSLPVSSRPHDVHPRGPALDPWAGARPAVRYLRAGQRWDTRRRMLAGTQRGSDHARAGSAERSDS